MGIKLEILQKMKKDEVNKISHSQSIQPKIGFLDNYC